MRHAAPRPTVRSERAGADRAKVTSGILKLVACLVAACWAEPLKAQPYATPDGEAAEVAEHATELDAARLERLWLQHWRTHTRGWCLVDGRFFYLAGFDPRYPSSLGKRRSEVREEFDLWWEDLETGRTRRRTLVSPRADADVAVRTLPRWAVGAYGRVRSVQFRERLETGEWVADHIVLAPPIDAAARARERQAIAGQLRDLNPDLARIAKTWTASATSTATTSLRCRPASVRAPA